MSIESEIPQVKLRRNGSSESRLQTFDEHSKDEEALATNAPKTKRARPKSASYAALRSAVFQLTCLSDFTTEKIGSGFFADVFKVKHKGTDEIMVLKMNKSKKTSKQMLVEIQLMNRLSHPNILKFKGSCVHEGQLHALTEYINGGSLEDLLHNRSVELSWSVRVKIARDIARGMAYLHSRGIFHRDLNSRNCLIQRLPNGTLTTVVADFGLAAKIKQRRRKSHTETVGSPYWMAPECLRGKNYCEQADVFSFGITLAEVVTRMPADPDFIPRTSQYGVNFEDLRKLCIGCPEELFQLMYKCCQMDPDDRPSFEEAVEILEAIPTEPDPNDQSSSTPPPSDDDSYLRSCFSEPFLRLSDVDSTTRSCDSEGDVHHYLGHRLDSVGSSTASTGSSCGSLNDDLRYPLADIAEMPSGSEHKAQISREPFTRSNLERSSSDGVVTRSVESATVVDSISEASPANDLDENDSHSTDTHAELRKTASLTLPGSDITKPDAQQKVQSTDLDCSIQTLIADEDVRKDSSEFANGGGDSGIDPGELEVFKFPPSNEARLEPIEIGITSLRENNEEGEQTPICSSPSHNSAYHQAIPIAYPTTPLKLLRSSSDESDSSMDAGPTSPFGQSWASSEFSFHLPHPSTPFAPPCTPVLSSRLSNSCPSSPTSHARKFRYSLDLTSMANDSPDSYHRRSNPSSRINSCRNSAVYFEQFDVPESSEHKLPQNPKRRSVHFEENDQLCTNLDRVHFSKMPSRNRSHSNPAPPIIKQSSNYSLTLARSTSNGDVISSPARTNTNSLLCKGYNVTLKSNARLSSSAPNLHTLSSLSC